jgi:hypothetical protein
MPVSSGQGVRRGRPRSRPAGRRGFRSRCKTSCARSDVRVARNPGDGRGRVVMAVVHLLAYGRGDPDSGSLEPAVAVLVVVRLRRRRVVARARAGRCVRVLVLRRRSLARLVAAVVLLDGNGGSGAERGGLSAAVVVLWLGGLQVVARRALEAAARLRIRPRCVAQAATGAGDGAEASKRYWPWRFLWRCSSLCSWRRSAATPVAAAAVPSTKASVERWWSCVSSRSWCRCPKRPPRAARRRPSR